MLAAPAVLVIATTTAYPLVRTIWLSFTGGSALTGQGDFVGLDNFVEAFKSDTVRSSFVATMYYVLGTTFVTITAAFGLALGIHSIGARYGRFSGVVKSALFLPVILPTVVSAVVWRSVFHPFGGVFQLLPLPGDLDATNWYQDETLVIPALIIFTVWKRVGLFVVMFLTGLAGLPKDIFEAAHIDGATAWQRVRFIVVPMMRPVFQAACVVSTVFAFQAFAIVFVSTGGGPAGASRILPILIYEEAFRNFRQGYASSLALVMLVAMGTLSAIQIRLLRTND